jgi:sulfhydrogenase subunit beta (sulfur reductase)
VVTPGQAILSAPTGIDALITALRNQGFSVKGPVVRDGAIVPGTLAGCSDLPAGWHDTQDAGSYRLRQERDQELFGWAVGPQSWKTDLLPPRKVVWKGHWEANGELTIEQPADSHPPVAIIGARPCETAAMNVLSAVMQGGRFADPGYAAVHDQAFLVVVECGSPAHTCFCTSFETGPGIDVGFDLALMELDPAGDHRFLARAGSDQGRAVLDELISAGVAREAGPPDAGTREMVLERARAKIDRHLDATDAPAVLERNQEHPRWAQIAERCLSCGNCTLVCPTCFCTSVEDTSDIHGDLVRSRRLASCFESAYSLLHSGPVRESVASRYRQWLTHKLATWVDQFGTSGCVGCGRCITWCPVGIDLTEEVAVIQRSEGPAETEARS